MSILVVTKDILLTPAGKLLPKCVEITHSGSAAPKRRQRRSRWDDDATVTGVLADQTGAAAQLPPTLTAAQTTAYVLRVRLEEITKTIVDNANAAATGAPMPHPGGGRTRSPSPPPQYDNKGRRTNTRELRMRDKLLRERASIVQQAKFLCPEMRLPPDYVAPQKKHIKIYLPEEDFPDTNFIGLIIGPRGNTQRRMEKESGAKISLRGRGSTKEGQLKRPGDNADSDEPLHLLISADTDEQLNMAYNMVKPLLMPTGAEVKEEYRKAQLMELAVMNGTVPRGQLITQNHQWLTGTAASYGNAGSEFTGLAPYDAGVVCSICGDQGHPDTDCPFKGMDPADIPKAKKKARIDNEFESFMAAIGETPAAKKEKEIDQTIDAFLSEIGETEKQQKEQQQKQQQQGKPGNVAPQQQQFMSPIDVPSQLPAAPPPPGSVPIMPTSLPPPMAPPGSYPPGQGFMSVFGFAPPQQQPQPLPPQFSMPVSFQPPPPPPLPQQQQQPPPPPPGH